MNSDRLISNMYRELELLNDKHNTGKDTGEPYYRGVRIGLETAISLVRELE